LGPQVAPKPPVGAESAYNRMSERNKVALQNQKIQDAASRKLRIEKEKESQKIQGAANRKLRIEKERENKKIQDAENRKLRIDREKDIRSDKNGSKELRHAVDKRRISALRKTYKSAMPLAQCMGGNDCKPHWQRSFSTGPPKSTASEPATELVRKGISENMVVGKVEPIDRKRKAEEGLEGSTAKMAKGNIGPYSNPRSAGPKRATAPAQNLTNHEAIFGKGSRPRVSAVNLDLSIS